MTNRGIGLDKFDYSQKMIAEWLEQAQWNAYSYLSLQLEAPWMDEGPDPEGWYDQFPTFNPADTEAFYSEIETALRLGARPLTISNFADWHRENVGDTAEMTYYLEDVLPDLRH